MRRVVVDTDTGVDDALALMLLAADPLANFIEHNLRFRPFRIKKVHWIGRGSWARGWAWARSRHRR